MPAVLIVPGLNDSGPKHWQSWWQAREPGAMRVAQTDWRTPDLARWAARVGESLEQAAEPVWIVAHSFGCLASVRAAVDYRGRVAGALLVAPADPARFGLDAELSEHPLDFPSLVVASTDDPWLSFERAAYWAIRWGSRLVNLGQAGHINAESGYGPWPQGQALFRELTRGDTPTA